MERIFGFDAGRRRSSKQRWCLRGVEEVDEEEEIAEVVEAVNVEEVDVVEEVVEVFVPTSK